MMLNKFKTGIALAATLLCTSALAETYYVSPDGTDALGLDDNSVVYGSGDSPWKTIDYAVDQATGGDTIYLLDGEYGAVYIDHVGDDFDDYLNILPRPGSEATINSLYVYGSHHLKFSNLNIIRGEEGAACTKWVNEYLVCLGDYYHRSSDIVLQNSLIKASGDPEEGGSRDSDYWQGSLGAIYVEGDFIEVNRNSIHNSQEVIFALNSKGVEFANNLANNNKSGISLRSMENVNISSNVLKNFYGGYVIVNVGDASKVSIVNNFINPIDDGDDLKGVGAVIISYFGMLEGWTISRNIMFSSGWRSVVVNDTYNLIASHNLELSIDPSKQSFGMMFNTTPENAEYMPEDLNKNITCNVVSAIDADGWIPEDDDHNVIDEVSSDDWYTKVNGLWHDDCKLELTYQLTDM